MFLRYILTREDEDLLLKFFNAQNREPTKNDWVITVKEDLEKLEIDIDFEEIKSMSKYSWLKIVKEACKKKLLLICWTKNPNPKEVICNMVNLKRELISKLNL